MAYEESFDNLLHDALQGDEQPSPDFTAHVMAKISETPQAHPVPRRKWVLPVAAAAVVAVVAIPMVWLSTLRMGKSADMMGFSADTDTTEAAIAEEAPAEVAPRYAQPEETVGGGSESEPVEDASRNETAMLTKRAQTNDSIASEKQYFSVLDDPGLCERLREWLNEQGVAPLENGIYEITEEISSALREAFPDLDPPEDAFLLDLRK